MDLFAPFPPITLALLTSLDALRECDTPHQLCLTAPAHIARLFCIMGPSSGQRWCFGDPRSASSVSVHPTGVSGMFEILFPNALQQVGRCHESCGSRGIPPFPELTCLSKACGCFKQKGPAKRHLPAHKELIVRRPMGEQGAVVDMRRGKPVQHECGVGNEVTACRTMA